MKRTKLISICIGGLVLLAGLGIVAWALLPFYHAATSRTCYLDPNDQRVTIQAIQSSEGVSTGALINGKVFTMLHPGQTVETGIYQITWRAGVTATIQAVLTPADRGRIDPHIPPCAVLKFP